MIPLSNINLSLYTYETIITDIIDADSLWGLVDRGFGDHSLRELRLNRIDAWEIRGEERPLGCIAKDFLEQYIQVGSKIIVESFGNDSFGRLLCELWFPNTKDQEWSNMSDLLVYNKHAVYKEYRQNSKRMFPKLAAMARNISSHAFN